MTRPTAQIARLVAVMSLLALGAATAPAVSAGNPCFHGYTMPPATTGTGTEVKLMPCAFEPTVTQVAVGAEVTFSNGPEFAHLITGANQEWGSPDVEVQPGKTMSYTFDDAGVYPYACVLHPGMSGAIIVGDLAEAMAAGTMTGGSTGASGSSGGGASAAESAATGSTADDPALGSLVLIALAVVAGLIAGAVGVWLAVRRRSMAEASLARAE